MERKKLHASLIPVAFIVISSSNCAFMQKITFNFLFPRNIYLCDKEPNFTGWSIAWKERVMYSVAVHLKLVKLKFLSTNSL